jgi:hydrogenase/urease accessory protein HupE
MKKPLAVAVLAPAPAFAHAGNHSANFAQNITHALSQPDHLLAALAVLALAYFAYRLAKG